MKKTAIIMAAIIMAVVMIQEAAQVITEIAVMEIRQIVEQPVELYHPGVHHPEVHPV